MNVFYKSKIVVNIGNQSNIVNCKIVFDDTIKNSDMDSDIESLLKTAVQSQDISSVADDIYKKIPPKYLSVKVIIEIETDHDGYEMTYDAQNNSVNVITDATGNIKGIITNKLGSVNVISIDSLSDKDRSVILSQLSGNNTQVPPTPSPPLSQQPSIKNSAIFNDNVKNVIDKINNFCPNTDLIDNLPNSDDPQWIKIKQQIEESKGNGGQNDNTAN